MAEKEEEENENIDKSQWIPLKEVKAHAEWQVKHGRKVYNGGSILPSKYNKPPIDRLFEDERIPDGDGHPSSLPVLESKHRDAGVSFKNLCDVAEGRFVVLKDPGEIVEQYINPAMKRAAVYYRLSRRQAYYVDRILFGKVTENDYAWMRKSSSTLQDAFESLWDAMRGEKVEAAINDIRKIELAKKNKQNYSSLNRDTTITS